MAAPAGCRRAPPATPAAPTWCWRPHPRRRNGAPSWLFWLLPAVFLEFVVKGDAINPQNAGGMGLVPVALLEHFADVRLLDLFERPRRLVRGATDLEGKVGGLNLRFAANHHRPFAG